MTSANKDSKILLDGDLDREPVVLDAVLFIQTEGVPGTADSTTTVLFIQAEYVTGCLHSAVYPNKRCVSEKRK